MITVEELSRRLDQEIAERQRVEGLLNQFFHLYIRQLTGRRDELKMNSNLMAFFLGPSER